MMPFGRNDYGHNFDFDGALGNLNEKELEKELFERVTCTICADVPTNPVETDVSFINPCVLIQLPFTDSSKCGHMFCEDCLDTYMHELVADDENDYMTCPQCNRVFNTHNRVPNPAAIDEDDNADRSNPGSSRSAGRSKKPLGHSGSKGRDELGFEPATPTDATWVTKSDHDPDFPLAPSSKTTALKALLLKGFEDAPLDKVSRPRFHLLAMSDSNLDMKYPWRAMLMYTIRSSSMFNFALSLASSAVSARVKDGASCTSPVTRRSNIATKLSRSSATMVIARSLLPA